MARSPRGSRRASTPFLSEMLEHRTLLASATVNWNDVKQTIDGFGVSSAWHSGTMPAAALEAAYGSTGADLSLLRMRMAPNGTTWEADMGLQAQSEGARVWSTPWSPPREWKTNHDNNNGGTLDPAHYQDYADLLANYAQDLQRQGVPLYALSLQNEPNWLPDYESCSWNADQFAAFVPIIGQALQSRGLTTKIMIPESLNWNFSLAAKVMADPNLAKWVGILGAHNYGETANSYQPVSIANGKQVWETENTTDKYTDTMQNALDLADDIHQALSDANANAYHYWWLNASGPAGLFDGSWNPTKRLWVMGQYSKFARPGWVRIGETDDGGLDITTFKDPASGKFAIVVANTSTTNAVNETFNLSGFSASSVTPWVTSLNDNLKQYGSISLTNGTSFTQSIAANSIVTYYGVSAAAPAIQAPNNVTAAPVQGNGGSQIAITWSDNSSSESGYTVERSTDNQNWTVATSSLAANTTRFVDTGRTENTRYYYRVKANGGPTSAVVSASTVLVQPRSWNISGTRTSTGVNLTWSIPSAAATGVVVERSYDGLKFETVFNSNTRATTFSDTVPNYASNQFLAYRVHFTAGSANSAGATWNTGLAAPTGLAVASATANTITLKWNDSVPGAFGAIIERAAVGSNSWTKVSPTSLVVSAKSFTVGGLAASTSYQFRMRTTASADSITSGNSATITASTVTPAVGPIVWYKADETGGTTLADSSGLGENGTLSGAAAFTAGKTGNALTLTGGYATLPNGLTDGLGNFTIATWIKASSIDSWARVFDFSSASGYMIFAPKAGSTNMPLFRIHGADGTEQAVNSSVSIAANAWTHVAITLSGNTATLYINGVVAGTNSNMTLRPSSVGTTTQSYLGRSQYSWDPTFKGSIDDFRLYERALSSSEVQALQTAAPPANAAPTVATAASASPSPVTGKTTALSVLGADDAGEAALTYTWATAGSPPAAVSFSANGTNAAKSAVATFSKAGAYSFVVTIRDAAGLTTTSSVNVTVNQTVTSIAVAPGSVTIAKKGTAQFSATASDQFGATLASQPSFAWSIASGNGSISSTGLFTAANNPGTTTVRATAGGVSATATVTVQSGQVRYSGTVIGTSGSLNNNGNTAAKAFDDNLSTYVELPVASAGWVGLDLGTAQVIGEIRFACRTGYGDKMVGGRFQASNYADFSKGISDMTRIVYKPLEGQLNALLVTNTTPFRYVRYIGPNNSYNTIAEIQVFGPRDVNLTKASGAVIGTAGSLNNNGNTGAKAFDNNLSTYVELPVPSGGWTGIDLGSAKTIGEIRFADRTGYGDAMVGGRFQASNNADFSSGIVDMTRIVYKPLDGQLNALLVTNTDAFRYVRYIGPNNSYGTIAEIQVFTV